MDINQASSLASSAVVAAIPLMFAGAGELVAEKSGVLNLGVEGMMLMGAVTGYAVTAITGNPWLGILGAIVAGVLMSLVFAFLTITMLANQVATGLSLTIFGIGFSAYIGKPYTSAAVRATIDVLPIPGLTSIPVIGPAFFHADAARLSRVHHVRRDQLVFISNARGTGCCARSASRHRWRTPWVFR